MWLRKWSTNHITDMKLKESQFPIIQKAKTSKCQSYKYELQCEMVADMFYMLTQKRNLNRYSISTATEKACDITQKYKPCTLFPLPLQIKWYHTIFLLSFI